MPAPRSASRNDSPAPADVQEAALLTSAPTNLPALRAPLIGRERALEQAGALLLRDDAALLTFTGLGGAGKTSLALHTAHALRGAFPDGVFFVNLAPIREADQILKTTAQTLKVQKEASRSVRECLVDFLRRSRRSRPPGLKRRSGLP
jgi:non-specific serine/threonine protein kinase